MSWICTNERALRSDPTEFADARTELDRRASDTEVVGDDLVSLGRSGWAGLEGQYADGLQYLAAVAGASVGSLAANATAADGAFAAAADELEALRIESDTLLTDAAATLASRDAADAAADRSQRYVTSWKYERDVAETPDEYQRANRLFWHHVGEREDHKDAVRLEEIRLGNHQRTFDRIREDEDEIHRRLGSDLRAVDFGADPLDPAPAGVVESLEGLLDLFDAALLGYVPQGRNFGWRTRVGIERSRRHLADLAGIDLDARDHAIRQVIARRTLDDLGPVELRRLLDEAFDRGDLAEVRRLMTLVFDGTTSMGDGERSDFLLELAIRTDLMGPGTGWERLITYAVTTDGELPAWMADAIVDLAPTFHSLFQVWYTDALEMLATVVGVDTSDRGLIADELILSLLRRIASTEDGHERLMGVIEGANGADFGGHYGHVIAFEYLLEHPELFGNLHSHRDESVNTVQRLLDLAASGSNEAGMDELKARLMARIVEQIVDFTPDTDHVLGVDMATAARQFGDVNYLFGRAGESGSYDPVPFLRFVGEQLVGTVPHGSTALDFIKGAEKFFDGYEPSARADELGADAARRESETLMAINLIIAGGGPIAEELAAVAADVGGPEELWHWADEHATTDLGQYVRSVRNTISDGNIDRLVGDD